MQQIDRCALTAFLRTVLLTFILSSCAVASIVVAQDPPTLEQHTESLRAQLRQIEEKEATLQARLRQLEEDLRPENIQSRMALNGTLNADQERDKLRQQIEGEQARVRQQLDSLATSRARLETSISEAEAETVQRRAASLAPQADEGSHRAAPATRSSNAILQKQQHDERRRKRIPARKRLRGSSAHRSTKKGNEK